MQLSNSEKAALRIAQEAVAILLRWAESPINFTEYISSSESTERAKQLLGFDAQSSKIGALQLLFDEVKLRHNRNQNRGKHWCKMQEIHDSDPIIPYPLKDRDSLDAKTYKKRVRDQLDSHFKDPQSSNWKNLSLLSLILEKYGFCLSYDSENVAFVDIARITGAVAAALAQNPSAEYFSLVAGDLSGIQSFIYTISSDGALKSLRARSFYLELVTEEIVQQLLDTLNLPRTSVIYAGGGNLYILAPCQEHKEKINNLQERLNCWLLKEFQGKVFLALDYENLECEWVSGSGFKQSWNQAIKKINAQKHRKFNNQLDQLLEIQESYTPCKVCHRDDTEDLELLNPNEADSSLACPTCRAMFNLGGVLFKINSLVRSRHPKLQDSQPLDRIKFQIGDRPEDYIYYHLFEGRKPIIFQPERVLLINNWSINDYSFSRFKGKTLPWLLGNYFQQGEEGYMRAGEFAAISQEAGCISRVGYLRMDVDNLGQIFAQGLEQTNNYSLPRLAGLSRQMSYFFKTYLNGLAKSRSDNLTENIQRLQDGERPHLLFIYAGGDDLFVVGAWHEVVEFSFDVYQAFRCYTGDNPDITLSAGISLAPIKYPLYQAADDSGDAEQKAKSNGRNSLGLFGQVFKWDAWLGNREKLMLSHEDRDYLEKVETVPLQGVLPFVRLLNQHSIEYSHSFVRNLLIVAELREQKIKEAEENEKRDISYFLHLPKLAYALSRLPKQVQENPEFKPIRQSLMSPRNSPYFRAIATWLELLNRES